MPLYNCYTWDFRLNVSPHERLMDLLDAFFSSYPPGDYTRELREEYKLEFRRGMWKRMLGFGPMAPARLPKGEFTLWPVKVRVLARPAPDEYLVSIRYELYLPRAIKELSPAVQCSVAQHIAVELEELARYLAQCIPLDEPPSVERA